MSIKSLITSIGLAVSVSVLSVTVTTAGVASAYSHSTYAAVCGSGYALKAVLSESWLGAGSYAGYGEVQVYTKQSGSATDWCAYSVRIGGAYGLAGNTGVSLGVPQGGGYFSPVSSDTGNYSYYAGPARIYNASTVLVYGQVSGAGVPVPSVRIPYDFYMYN